MTVFKDSHDFSRTLGNVSAELWAMFDDNLSRPPSLQQNFGQCSMTAFKDSHDFSRTLGNVSAELWAMFEDSLYRPPSLQQNFKQCLMTVFNDNAFLERTLRGRLREKCRNAKTHAQIAKTHARIAAPLRSCSHQTNSKVAAGSVSPTSMKKTTRERRLNAEFPTYATKCHPCNHMSET